MKQLVRLKKDYKKLLAVNGYVHKQYLTERDTSIEIVFFNTVDKSKLIYKKKDGVLRCY